MDFTNEINTLESEKLRLEEMLKRNNDRLQLLKEASTEPSSDGYRRFFKLKGYSLLYTGGERLNHERFIFNCTLVSTAGHLSHKYWNVEDTYPNERCLCLGNYNSALKENISLYKGCCIATFIVPEGAEYFENKYGHIVSSEIIYTGKYLRISNFSK